MRAAGKLGLESFGDLGQSRRHAPMRGYVFLNPVLCFPLSFRQWLHVIKPFPSLCCDYICCRFSVSQASKGRESLEMSESNVGLTTAYQGNQGARRQGPREIFEMLVRKTQLRALMEVESSRIAEALPHLSAAETEQLQSMLAGEVADCNADVAALAQQVDREASLVASTKAMDVRLSREASRVLQAEMMCQIERRGFCPPPTQLAGEAIVRAFGGRQS
jgi:hypothetical protein